MYKKKHLFQLMVLRPVFIGIFISLFLLVHDAFAAIANALPGFVKEDQVLVLAPQPDDETIGVGGVMQRAIKAGAEVKVVLLTNGENNVFSFMVYKKRLFFGRKSIIRMGEARRQESIKAMFYEDTNAAYRILELEASVDDDEVKKAYRKMANKYHPDKVAYLGEDIRKAAGEKFRKVKDAYDTIKKDRGMN